MVSMRDEGAKRDRPKADGSVGIDGTSQPLDKLQGCLVVLIAVGPLGVVKQLISGRFVEERL